MTHDDEPSAQDDSGTQIARVYNALLGGKDNYEADREVRDQFTAVAPEFTALARDNEQFLLRATRFLAGEAGIDQFLDFGPCLPVDESMHEVVQRLNSEATVLYVGIDPLVLAHGRMLLAGNEQSHIMELDWRTEDVVSDPTVRKHIDFERPVAICHVGTLMHVGDEYDPCGLLRRLIDACAPGSYVAFAHLLDPGEGHELAGLAARVQEIYLASGMASGWFRTIDRINAMLAGLDPVEPGLVPLADWWPDGPHMRPPSPIQHLLVGAVARKP